MGQQIAKQSVKMASSPAGSRTSQLLRASLGTYRDTTLLDTFVTSFHIPYGSLLNHQFEYRLCSELLLQYNSLLLTSWPVNGLRQFVCYRVTVGNLHWSAGCFHAPLVHGPGTVETQLQSQLYDTILICLVIHNQNGVTDQLEA